MCSWFVMTLWMDGFDQSIGSACQEMLQKMMMKPWWWIRGPSPTPPSPSPPGSSSCWRWRMPSAPKWRREKPTVSKGQSRGPCRRRNQKILLNGDNFKRYQTNYIFIKWLTICILNHDRAEKQIKKPYGCFQMPSS